jgi:hypothetical protein
LWNLKRTVQRGIGATLKVAPAGPLKTKRVGLSALSVAAGQWRPQDAASIPYATIRYGFMNKLMGHLFPETVRSSKKNIYHWNIGSEFSSL